MDIEKNLEASQEHKTKWRTFFLKELKKNTETTEQEPNKSLNWKEIISPEPFPFKGFPSKTKTKIAAISSHLKSQKKNWITKNKKYGAEFTIKE